MSCPLISWILREVRGLSAAERVIAAAAADYANAEGYFWVSSGQLARDVEVSKKTVLDTLALLVEHKLFKKIEDREDRRELMRRFGQRLRDPRVCIYRIIRREIGVAITPKKNRPKPEIGEPTTPIKAANGRGIGEPTTPKGAEIGELQTPRSVKSTEKIGEPTTPEPLRTKIEPLEARERAPEPPEDFQSVEKQEGGTPTPEPPDAPEPKADPAEVRATIEAYMRERARPHYASAQGVPPKRSVAEQAEAFASTEDKIPKQADPRLAAHLAAQRQALTERAAALAHRLAA